eukprot:XP_016661828.1 PREDICTED: uncharacterized protein LOC107884392 [Acyrthosiphon pisum]
MRTCTSLRRSAQCTRCLSRQRNSRKGKYGLNAPRLRSGGEVPPPHTPTTRGLDAARVIFPVFATYKIQHFCNNIIIYTRCVTCHHMTVDILKAVLVGMVNDRPRPPVDGEVAANEPAAAAATPRDKRYHAVFECLRFHATILTTDDKKSNTRQTRKLGVRQRRRILRTHTVMELPNNN